MEPKHLGFTVSVVMMANNSNKGQIDIDPLMDRLIAQPEIQQVHLLMGRYDLIVYMIVRSMDYLKDIARTAFSDSEDISSYKTSIVYDPRSDYSVPLPTD